MYNLFHHEKKLNELKKKLEEAEKEERIKKKRKNEVVKLSRNYDEKVKDFIYNMATSPITVSNYKSPIDNTRKKLIEDENYKIKGKKGFTFNRYKTEKERISDYLKDIGTINSKYNMTSLKDDYSLAEEAGKSYDLSRKLSPNQHNETLNNQDNKDSIKKKKLFVQPTMRFRPRNDLERIIDTVDQNHTGGLNKRLMSTLRKRFGLNIHSKKEEESEDSLVEYQFVEKERLVLNKEKERAKGIELLNLYEDGLNKEKSKEKEYYLTVGFSPNKKIFYSPKNASSEVRKKFKENKDLREGKEKKNNIAAKQILKDLYNKTHFKGATEFATISVKGKSGNVERTVGKEEKIEKNRKKPQMPKSKNNVIKLQNYNLNQPNRHSRQGSIASDFSLDKKRQSYDESLLYKGNATEIMSQTLGRFEQVNSILSEGNISDEDLLKTSPLFFNINSENFGKNKRSTTFDEKKLKEITLLAFPKLVTINQRETARKNKIKQIFGLKKNKILDGETITNSLRNLKIEGLGIVDIGNKKKDDEERVIIDKEIYDKKDVNLIAKKILQKCNYSHEKHYNAKNSLKKDSGKLMMTNGMSIKKFKEKYNV